LRHVINENESRSALTMTHSSVKKIIIITPHCTAVGRGAVPPGTALAFLDASMKTYVYVDAFNLYFGCVKGTPHKWLDLSNFTAHVRALPNSPNAPLRQQVYLRALLTLSNFEIVYGHFLSHHVRMPLANPGIGQPKTVEVIKTEEKGSDVNLAVHLIHDAYQNRYESAVIVSGDSDLLTAVQIVKNELGKPVGVLNPQKRPSRMLQQHATFYKHIRPGVLAASQFPKTLSDQHGAFNKPSEW
jgi:uncharacterized LabA/DUF88 family protein